MRVVYVAGPITAATCWLEELNVRRAEAVALELWKSGYAAICVHAAGRFYAGEATKETWLRGDLEILRRCDVVVVCDGWEGSPGTLGEIAEAQRNAIPVFYSVAALKTSDERLKGRE